MDPLRKPGQGVWNIIRFNWHFYVIALAVGLVLVGARAAALPSLRPYFDALLLLSLVPVLLSLAVSFYVYDLSSLYQLSWLPAAARPTGQHTVLSINAGFDEISPLLQGYFRPATLLAADFYDPAQHTEVSIQRARRAYPPFAGTCQVSTQALPFATATADKVFAFLAAHEIRDAAERATFFRELARVTKLDGQIIVTEHLRDTANFLAYNVGFLHFQARSAWLATFEAAGLMVQAEVKVTPFITTFLLSHHGATA